MRIAFIGWGSLVWGPGSLRIKETWYDDGPVLPVEYRRYSKGGIMTLVLCPGVQSVRTLWAEAEYTKLSDAIENLRIRENIPLGSVDRIGFVIAGGRSRCNTVPEAAISIYTWVETKKFDAAVWTDLPQNPMVFQQQTDMEMNEENIVTYLRDMEARNDHSYKDAREYIERTPAQIYTRLRKKIRQELARNVST